MSHIALITTKLEDFFVVDDALAIEALRSRGHRVSEVPWRDQEFDWSRVDLAIIRTPWDYQSDARGFLQFLERVSGLTQLQNPLSVVQWNMDKRYLLKLKELGLPIVPSIQVNTVDPGQLAQWQMALGASKLLIKPLVGANADGIVVFEDAEELHGVSSEFWCDGVLVQPFLEAIEEQGEVSQHFFAGHHSHSILKVPKRGDFRVQEEHGGDIQPYRPSVKLTRESERVLQVIEKQLNLVRPLLYARLDWVWWGEHADDWRLMEVELIEPSLYFRMHPDAPANFANAIEGLLHTSVAV